MNEFDSDWISLSQSFVQNGWIQDGRIQDGCHHQVESEWMSEVFCANGGNQSWQVWVSLRGNTKMAESKMVEFKLAEFKMAAIIKLSQNEWEKFFFCAKWLNPRWPNSRWLPSSSWVRMKEFEADWNSLSQSFVQNGWIEDGRIKDGRIQDGCHHQVRWEGMSLSQIELVWFRVRVEWECFWVNLREDNKGLNPRWQCLNSTWQNSRWLPSSSWVRMNEWSFFVQMVGTNLGKCEWVWEEILRWLNPRWWNSRWLPSSS